MVHGLNDQKQTEQHVNSDPSGPGPSIWSLSTGSAGDQLFREDPAVYQIEKNVPVPEPHHRNLNAPCKTDILRSLRIRESALFPWDCKDNDSARASLRSLCRRLRPRRFTQRSLDEGIRVWRIA